MHVMTAEPIAPTVRLQLAIGQQQVAMAMAALCNQASGTTSPKPAEPIEDGFRVEWWVACPYCSARTYRLTHTAVAGGILISGECTRCHTKGQSLMGPGAAG